MPKHSEHAKQVAVHDVLLHESLMALAEADSVRIDKHVATTHWYRLALPEHIVDAARVLAQHKTRLAMVTAYNSKHLQEPVHEVCYHFEKQGIVYNVTVLLDEEHHIVPSITSIFRNADWHEREMMELYDIVVQGHPNPRRLFLDPELDSGIMGEAVPLSIMMNGACTVDLWERIMKDTPAHVPDPATEGGV